MGTVPGQVSEPRCGACNRALDQEGCCSGCSQPEDECLCCETYDAPPGAEEPGKEQDPHGRG